MDRKSRKKIELAVRNSPQFDFCYALADLVSPTPLLASGLFEILPEVAWLEGARVFGWSRWFAVPHLLDEPVPAESVDRFIERIARTNPRTVDRRLTAALTHSADGRTPSRKKAEWLHFIGLDPTDVADWSGRADLNQIVATLKAFQPWFERVWKDRQPHLEAIAEKAEKLARGGDFADAIEAFDLPIEIDRTRRCLRALRGGHVLRLDDIGAVYLIPSLFNARRLWNMIDRTLPATLFLPVGSVHPDDLREDPSWTIDPWLACRAIGDPARAVMLRRIAATPQTASDLAAAMGLSKANVSHHIFQLREAGLIDEQRSGRFVQLSARLDTVDRISATLRRELEAGSSSAISSVRSGR